MRVSSISLSIVLLIGGCASTTPKLPDIVYACGLEESEGWTPLSEEISELPALLSQIDLDSSYRSLRSEKDSSIYWLTNQAKTRLAFCRQAVRRFVACYEAVEGYTTTFSRLNGSWVQDKEIAVPMCKPVG